MHSVSYTPGEKIALARGRMGPKGWSQTDLAHALARRNALGLDERKWRSRIANYESNRPTPPAEPLRHIADALGVVYQWFLEPEGEEPLLKGQPVEGALFTAPAPYSPPGKVPMIYAGEVPCSTNWGNPLESTTPIDMDPDFAGPNRYVCRVVNDSCYPALHEGDLTVWQYDLNPPFGTIVLAQRKGDHNCTAKLLRYDATLHAPRLVPINPRVEPPEDGEGWGAIARLVGVERVQDGLKRTWKLESGLRPKHLLPDID